MKVPNYVFVTLTLAIAAILSWLITRPAEPTKPEPPRIVTIAKNGLPVDQYGNQYLRTVTNRDGTINLVITPKGDTVVLKWPQR